MTVSYTSKIASTKGIGGCFLKLLIRWKGSVYKLVWSDLIFYLCTYYTIYFTYMFAMDDTIRSYFRDFVKYFSEYGSLIPLSFVLGFYVDLVMERWWSQYKSLPFPDNLAIMVGASIKGQDDKARAVKRTIVRYACATFTLTLTMISPKIKRRFPTLHHMVEAGLLTKEEKQIMEDLDSDFPGYSKYWLPLAWASKLVVRAKEEGLIRNEECMEQIFEELNQFRNACGALLDYDWISIPLVYTQVVTIAVYSYFFISVIGNQPINSKDDNIVGSFFPVIPVLEFMFYMGWLKVAETLANPFGDDDDDFDVMWMVDRHLQMVFLIVDKIPQRMPKLTKDPYWIDLAPIQLPFTRACENYMGEYPSPSTDKITVSNEEQEVILPQFSKFDASGKKGLTLLTAKNKKMMGRDPLVLKTVISEDNATTSDEIDEGNNLLENSTTKNDDLPTCDVFEKLRKIREEEYKLRFQNMLANLQNMNKES